MRSTRNRLLCLAVVPLFVLAGCGSDADDSSAEESPTTTTTSPEETEETETTGSVEDVELSFAPAEGGGGDEGGEGNDGGDGDEDRQVPTLTLPETPFSVADTDLSVVTEGEGEQITEEQDVTLRYMAVNGTSGEEVLSTFPADQTVVMELGNPTLLEGLREGIVGQNPGAELLLAVPPHKGFREAGEEGLGIGAEDTMVFYIEVESARTPLTQAEGEPVEPVEGLPTVEADGENPAEVTIPEGEDPPQEMVVQPLIRGEGPEVQDGQAVEVHYTGVTWQDGEQFDSSLERGQPFAFQVGAGNVIEGWDQGLVGQPVGSRVMLVVPPEQAYGEDPDQHELAGQTLVFVVDILRAQ